MCVPMAQPYCLHNLENIHDNEKHDQITYLANLDNK